MFLGRRSIVLSYVVHINLAHEEPLKNPPRSHFLRSGILPLRSLAIQPGRAARVLFVDVVCMAYSGNIIDAALLAIMAALKNSQLACCSWSSVNSAGGSSLLSSQLNCRV